MANDMFFEALFPRFWETLDQRNLTVDAHSMFGEPELFEWIVRTVKPSDIIEVG